MRRFTPAPKLQALILALALIALGFSGLAMTQTTNAMPATVGAVGPQCGPTYQWSCVVPGCPSCPEYYFVGTVCEKDRFEKQNGLVCTPI